MNLISRLFTNELAKQQKLKPRNLVDPGSNFRSAALFRAGTAGGRTPVRNCFRDSVFHRLRYLSASGEPVNVASVWRSTQPVAG